MTAPQHPNAKPEAIARVTQAEILVARRGVSPEDAAKATGASIATLRTRLARRWRKRKLPPGIYDREMGVDGA